MTPTKAFIWRWLSVPGICRLSSLRWQSASARPFRFEYINQQVLGPATCKLGCRHGGLPDGVDLVAIADTGFTPAGKVFAIVKDDTEGAFADAGLGPVDNRFRRQVELVQVDTA